MDASRTSASGMVPVAPILESTRAGNRTVADAREVVIGLEVRGSGPASARDFVPTNERTRALLATRAGAGLERALRRFASQADAHTGQHALTSFTLAPDIDAIAALSVARDIGNLPAELPQEQAKDLRLKLQRMAARELADLGPLDGVNGGFTTLDGRHVYIMPEHSRALLAAVGAYDPEPRELARRTATEWNRFMPGLLRHEVEHTITPSPGGPDYLEEGTAEVLSNARPVAAAARHDLPPVSRFGRVSGPARDATAGWQHIAPFPKGESPSNARYDARRQTVLGLLELAGISPDSRAGYDKARVLLQGAPLDDVPHRVASAISERHRLDPARLDALTRAVTVLESVRPEDRIDSLRREFGLERT